MTVVQGIELASAIIGAASTIATALGAVLPKGWKVTPVLVRWAGDLRAIRKTEEEVLAKLEAAGVLHAQAQKEKPQ